MLGGYRCNATTSFDGDIVDVVGVRYADEEPVPIEDHIEQ